MGSRSEFFDEESSSEDDSFDWSTKHKQRHSNKRRKHSSQNKDKSRDRVEQERHSSGVVARKRSRSPLLQSVEDSSDDNSNIIDISSNDTHVVANEKTVSIAVIPASKGNRCQVLSEDSSSDDDSLDEFLDSDDDFLCAYSKGVVICEAIR